MQNSYHQLLTDFCTRIGLSEIDAVRLFKHLQKHHNLLTSASTNEAIPTKVFTYYQERLVPHKAAVFKAGIKISGAFNMPKPAIIHQLLIHDLSKFSIEEMAYADMNFKDRSKNSPEALHRFKLAWHHHKMNNPHHPEYWFDIKKNGSATPLPIPTKYIAEMLADWMGASKTYGSSFSEWLPNNLPQFIFHPETAQHLSIILADCLNIKTRIKDPAKGILEVV